MVKPTGYGTAAPSWAPSSSQRRRRAPWRPGEVSDSQRGITARASCTELCRSRAGRARPRPDPTLVGPGQRRAYAEATAGRAGCSSRSGVCLERLACRRRRGKTITAMRSCHMRRAGAACATHTRRTMPTAYADRKWAVHRGGRRAGSAGGPGAGPAAASSPSCCAYRRHNHAVDTGAGGTASRCPEQPRRLRCGQRCGRSPPGSSRSRRSCRVSASPSWRHSRWPRRCAWESSRSDSPTVWPGSTPAGCSCGGARHPSRADRTSSTRASTSPGCRRHGSATRW